MAVCMEMIIVDTIDPIPWVTPSSEPAWIVERRMAGSGRMALADRDGRRCHGSGGRSATDL
ncbi:hypothetical protein GTV32_03250 [Gordonia sp. SID5947]|uniref:hypothetical protein n=1 Tax=Gordonia sp. SID5947 TaxID=2690315 RepID=UPI00136E10FB|nr:hypothetical protein [Gordonia sp. SID5947]MYR05389.1 hypothetical protein [Gordonia sp. SID5947]